MSKLIKWHAGREYVDIVDMSGADSDQELVALWLKPRESPHTRRAYSRYAKHFLAHVGKPLRQITIADLQRYTESIVGADSSRATAVNALKSLLSYAHRTGYAPFNVGAAMSSPRAKETLSERILSEVDVLRMLAQELHPRNRVLLRLLYGSGARASEISVLKWQDVKANGDTGQIALYGKGKKTRMVLLSPATWIELSALRGDADDKQPVFVSRKQGGHLEVSAIRRIVYRAASRIGIHAAPHWLRHAHASHALDHGAPIHLVQATLGHASVATTGRYLHARPNESSARFLAV